MNKIFTVDFSQYTDEQIIGYATWLNQGQPVDDAVAFLINRYITAPFKAEIKQFNEEMALAQMQAALATQIEQAQNALIISTQ